MALSTKVGILSSPTSTGNLAVTGVGFVPKVVLFYGSLVAVATGVGVGSRTLLGCATGTANRWAFGGTGVDNTGSSALDRVRDNTKCISYTSGASAVILAADFVSFDADGFTLNWTTVLGVAAEIHYIAIGGTDVSAFASTFSLNAGTGSQPVTGVGFQPKLVIFAANRADTTNGTTLSHSSTIGAASSSSKEWATTVFGVNGILNTSDEQRGFINDGCILRVLADLSFPHRADFTSMDADGFTINVSVAGAVTVGYLAIGGTLQVDVGTFLQKTSSGMLAHTGVGFQPELLIQASSSSVTVGSGEAHSRQTFGATTGAAARGASSISRTNASGGGVTEEARYAKNTKWIGHISGNTPTVDAEADLSSMDADGWTNNWTTADAVERVHGYIAMRSAAVGGGGAIPVFLSSFRRRRA